MAEMPTALAALLGLVTNVAVCLTLWVWALRVGRRRGGLWWALAAPVPLGLAAMGLGLVVSITRLGSRFSALAAGSADPATALDEQIRTATVATGAGLGLELALLLVSAAGSAAGSWMPMPGSGQAGEAKGG